jgi:hypothetical protein
MNTDYPAFILKEMKSPDFRCPVCGAPLYVTDQGNHEWTFHCSSSAARFWDFPRGSTELRIAKQHWDQSKKELVKNMLQ